MYCIYVHIHIRTLPLRSSGPLTTALPQAHLSTWAIGERPFLIYYTVTITIAITILHYTILYKYLYLYLYYTTLHYTILHPPEVQLFHVWPLARCLSARSHWQPAHENATPPPCDVQRSSIQWNVTYGCD